VDTRTKIVEASEAESIARNGAVVVSGYFDPLTASHAERLAGLKTGGAKLLVLIATPGNPILPARARAELVASLGVVDYVSELNGTATPQVRLESEDELRLAKLIEHVHSRQSAAS
jgi:bifunctional ADP-heptose synthase (sugar kinase/adenylyltransferase)